MKTGWKFVFAAIVAMAVQVGVAVDAVWVNGTASTATWTDLSNWTDSQGESLAVAPTNASDSATLSVPTDKDQTISFPAVTPIDIGEIYGNWRHILKTANPSDNVCKEFRLRLGDVSGFSGVWEPGRTKAVLEFTGASREVEMSDLSVAQRPQVAVPSGTHVTLTQTTTGGSFHKTGAGSLTLVNSNVGDSEIAYVDEGVLELSGNDVSGRIPGDPVFWVDASDTNRMEVAHDSATGRDYVSMWYDCRYGDGIHGKSAEPIVNANISKPWISAFRQNGRTVLDFGAKNGGDVETLGPCASLTYDLGAKAKELFVVWMDTAETYSDVFFIGQRGYSYQFHRGYSGSALGALLANEASADVKNGQIRLDGNLVAYTTRPTVGKFHMVNYAMLNDGLQPSTFCNDRGTTRYGGARIAEAIFYTNALTKTERMMVTSYLQSKWFGKVDLNVLRVSGTSAAVSVPKDRVARVREAVAQEGRLRKEGEGELRVARFQPESPSIEVANGTVTLDGDIEMPSDDGPAAGPVFWGDPSDENSLETTTEGGKKFVTRWKDRRPGSPYYAEAGDKAGRNPFVSENACNGRDVIDFGTYGGGDESYMVINCGNVIREVFQVVRIPRNGYNSGPNIFGCGGQGLLRSGTASLLSRTYAYLGPSAGIWTMNGSFVDPWADYYVNNSEYYVVSFASETLNSAQYLGTDRALKWGDTMLGEIIAYDRRLTDVERRQTIAYLMKRWKGAGTPFTAPAAKIGKVIFPAENTSPKLAAHVDTTVANVELSGQGMLTKVGSGKLVVEARLPQDVSEVHVSEGELSAAYDFLPDAVFHVDASQKGSFEFRKESGSEDSIVKWNDCRRNGLYARSMVGADGGNYANLTNGIYNVAAAGDGSSLLPGSAYVDLDNGGMHFYEDGVSTIKAFEDLREYHVVFSLLEKGNHPVVGGPRYETDVSAMLPCGDNMKNIFYLWGKCAVARTSWIKTDSETSWRNNNCYLSNSGSLTAGQFYVLSVVATNNLTANSFALDRNGSAGKGKIRICEAIFFRGATNTQERANAIHAYLQKKWMGIGEGASIPVKLDEASVAQGAKLSLSSEMPYEISRIAGAGSFDLGAVSGVAKLDACFDAEGQMSPMTVNGKVSFASSVAVAVSMAAPKLVKPGTYVLLRANGGLDGIPEDLSGWTLSGLEGIRGCGRLRCVGNEIRLEISPLGLMIILR